SEAPDLVDYLFKDKLDYVPELLQWKKMDNRGVQTSLDTSYKLLDNIKIGEWSEKKITDVLMKETEKTGDRGGILWPLRVALSGKKASAGPFEIANVLGKEKTLKRLKQAIEKL
ncbi:MAG: glutamate--tRNA ligase, partial [Parcubacteria group bacterium]|nr:glutamate--tRNA ligase [Parcubacteria group bacterium]